MTGGGALASAGVALSLVLVSTCGGVSGASTIRAAAPNPFCQAMIATHPQPPTGANPTTYHSFARRYLPYYQRLASKAPNAAVRQDLDQLIAIMKLEAAAPSKSALKSEIAGNQVKWARDWTIFGGAVVACAKWVVNLL